MYPHVGGTNHDAQDQNECNEHCDSTLARACRKETRLRTDPGSMGYNEIEADHQRARRAIERVPQEHQMVLHQLLKAIIGLGEICA
jgi:hypothetical protein